ncbi:hypothetical protein NKJ23_00545 [Mesorhizobium sp. M0184]|uniref:hypothetical protein n=1 Tax=Mesorhizobium sp. M0184 TaxID=2956906 RepID=UPI0033358A1D
MTTFFSQADFAKDQRYLDVREGTLFVSYTDNTHIKEGEWNDLISIGINEPPTSEDDRECSFRLKLNLDKKFLSSEDDRKDIKEKDRKDRIAKVVIDAISLSATRLGILSPLVSGKTAEQLLELRSAKGIVLIPDTNSLYNGTLHWLLNVLKDTTVWLMPFVMSLTQMQAREATLKSLARSGKDGNLVQALRSRALVNAGLSFLERNQHRYQVLELDPSLLRYMRAAGKGGLDQDEGDVLEDRLLIEGVHAVLRSTRTRAKQLVVTSDVLLSRVLGAEGIPNICLPTPKLQEDEISSFRYDAWAGTFMGTSIRGLLWDLTHAFGTVRIRGSTKTPLSLTCYWPGKQPQDWVAEYLDVRSSEDDPSPAKKAGSARAAKSNDREAKDATPANPKRVKAKERVDATTSEKAVSGADAHEPAFSHAAIPQSSLPLALRIAGALYASGKLSFAELMEKLPAANRPNEGNVRRSLEVVRRAKLVDFDGETIISRAELDVVESCLQRADLDGISDQFRNFEPYRVILEHFQQNGELAREHVRSILAAALGADVAQEASIRLVRYHVLLGQCWSDGAVWRDGSRRPDPPSFLQAFEAAYEDAARDNIAQVSEFLPNFCRAARISPWGVSRSVQEHARVLSEKFTFGYAVGGKPTGVDAVISGSLLGLEEVPVPMDRFEIGGRPVFTLERVR